MRDATLNALVKLLKEGSLPASGLSHSTWRELQPLVDSGALAVATVGAGRRCLVVDAAAVEGLLRGCRPGWREGRRSDLSPRAAAVHFQRDAKRANSRPVDLLPLRGWQDDCQFTAGERTLAVAAHTRQYGVAALLIEADDAWTCNQPLAMIENKEPFLYAERLAGAADCGAITYYAGNLGTPLLNWLASRRRAPAIVFLPDYDPVGLANFLKARQASAAPVRLHVPDDFEARLARHGKARLLADNVRLLPSLQASGDEQVLSLLALMQRHGCGLEQEALLG